MRPFPLLVAFRYPAAAGGILACAAVVAWPLAIYASLGLAALLAASAIALLIPLPRRGETLSPTLSRGAAEGVIGLAVLLAALGLWATTSTLWSVLPMHSLFEGLRFLALCAGGLLLLAAAIGLGTEERRRVGDALIFGFTLALLLLLLERTSNGAVQRLVLAPGAPSPRFLVHLERGATVLAFALWPVLAGLAARGQRRRAVLCAAATAAAVLLAGSHAAILAVFAGLVAFAAGAYAPKSVAALLGAICVLLVVGLPFAVPPFAALPAIQRQLAAPAFASGIHRLVIWRFVAERIAERPLFGWGMDAARGLPGGDHLVSEIAPGVTLPPGARALPLHPHDAALQWRLELGLPGAALCLAIVGFALWRIAGLAPLRRAASLAAVAAAIVVSSLSFGFWQAWWLSCLWLTAAFLAAAPDQGAGSSASLRPSSR
jgi:exopolysaccharide production protein ExoQ